MASIYIIENNINGKQYVGQTVNRIDLRFKKHLAQINSKNQCTALYSAIRKYGKENFTVKEIISGDFDKDKLNDLEIHYISIYNTMSPNGYNLQTGGNSFHVSESTKKKTSAKLIGREILWKDKISKTMLEKWKNEKYINEMTIVHSKPRGKYTKHSKPLRIKLPLDQINIMHLSGDTIYKIAKFYNVSHSVIKKRII